MIVGFEDAFTEAQADYISLCLELAQNDVDVVYGWIYQQPGMLTCNVFFRKNGEIKTMDDLASDEMIDSFYDVAFEDVKKLRDICARYEHKCPNHIKMVYDVRTKHFDANYIYMDAAEIEKVYPDDVFNGWIEEEKAKSR